jgi:hypothetical protein
MIVGVLQSVSLANPTKPEHDEEFAHPRRFAIRRLVGDCGGTNTASAGRAASRRRASRHRC